MVLMMCLMFSVNSCKDDDDDDGNGNHVIPSYVGTWELGDDEFMQELVITESTFKMTMALYIDNEWIDIMSVQGNYTVDGDIFMLTITKLGIIADEETYEMVYYYPDDPEWDLLLDDEFEIEDQFEVKFVVSGNTLTVISDDNDDGVFDPVEEGETFTKV